MTVKSIGCGFDPYLRKYNIYLHLYFHFFALVSRHGTALSSATQHGRPPEVGGESGTKCLSTDIYTGYSVKQKEKLNSDC